MYVCRMLAFCNVLLYVCTCTYRPALPGHVTDCVQISCIDIKSTDERLALKFQEIKYIDMLAIYCQALLMMNGIMVDCNAGCTDHIVAAGSRSGYLAGPAVFA